MAIGGVGGSTLAIRMRNAGSDDTGSNYSEIQLEYTTSVSSGRSTGLTRARVGIFGAGQVQGLSCEIYAPFTANATTMVSVSASIPSALVGYNYTNAHTPTTSQSGFTIFGPSGNFTGTIDVFGYSKG